MTFGTEIANELENPRIVSQEQKIEFVVAIEGEFEWAAL